MNHWLHSTVECSTVQYSTVLVTQDSDREAITGKLGMFCCCYGSWLSMTSIETMHDYGPLDEGTLDKILSLSLSIPITEINIICCKT